jgi:hypothetical protein
MKVFEIQHPNNNNSLVTVKNIEGVSLVTETENVEYAGDIHERTEKSFKIYMKSNADYTIKSTDKIYSLSDSHRNGKWEIKRNEIPFDEFYTEIAIALIQQD